MTAESAFARSVASVLHPTTVDVARKATGSAAQVLAVDRHGLRATVVVDAEEAVAHRLVNASPAALQAMFSMRRGDRALKADFLQAWAGEPLPFDGVALMVRLSTLEDLNAVARGEATVSIADAA